MHSETCGKNPKKHQWKAATTHGPGNSMKEGAGYKVNYYHSSRIGAISVAVKCNINHLRIMPRAVSMKIKSRQETEEFISSPELSEDEIPVKNCEKPNIKSDKTITIYETDAKSGGTDCAVVNNKNTDFGNDLRKMLDVFGTDVSKALQAKKQRLEQYTAGRYKTSSFLNEMNRT
jgi:hypothetical protein